MLSILIDRDFDRLIENNIYPKINIMVIEHEYSEMSDVNSSSIEDFGLCSISNYSNTPLNEEDYIFIKCYGEPRLIQSKSRYYEALEKDNYSFFLMIDENGYSVDLLEDVFMSIISI